MVMNAIEADYVVIGAGAMGMAFADEILTRSDASIAIIDAHAKPGGHWNDAYPFVHLHQPSSFYGVNSKELGSGEIDQVGWNAGLSELASVDEVVAYFDQVMRQRFLPSGRVQYLPRAHYEDGKAQLLTSQKTIDVRTRKSVVDATYMKVAVPSVTPPKYEIEEGVRVVAPNELPGFTQTDGGYVIVGAGKTAIDAVLWLLANHVAPEDIKWIMPRDSWFLNRAMTQPGEKFRIGEHIQIIAEANTPEQVFEQLEATQHFLRLDQDVTPTMYRCATVSLTELEQLRRIKNIIRKGRVEGIEPTRIELAQGAVAAHPDTIYINCTADGLAPRDPVTVFKRGHITLQTLVGCQQVFSAAMLGAIETLSETSLEEKNKLAAVIPHPSTPIDFFNMTAGFVMNFAVWSSVPELSAWLKNSRLSVFGSARKTPDPAIGITALQKLQAFSQQAAA
ncbi:MAG: NAD(P)-binding protein [Pseudomonadota bacterium]